MQGGTRTIARAPCSYALLAITQPGGAKKTRYTRLRVTAQQGLYARLVMGVESCRSSESAVVAALFVETGGAYWNMEGVDPWDESRDARKYAGPYPVVAHPPCQRWGAMAAVNYARWGGDHNLPGNDGGCFTAALAAVRKWGGVLEHPAKSHAWAAHGLKKPSGAAWQGNPEEGFVCEVWQSAYGHRAAKATWLYYAGRQIPVQLRPERLKGTHQIGFQDQRGKARNKPTLGRREANATPPDFQAVLLGLARRSMRGSNP